MRPPETAPGPEPRLHLAVSTDAEAAPGDVVGSLAELLLDMVEAEGPEEGAT
jgi:hypothetical protein